jgi:hypothetical protein
MKTILLILSLTLFAFIAVAQETPPTQIDTVPQTVIQQSGVTEQTPVRLNYQESYLKGQRDVSTYQSGNGWFWAGLGCGLVGSAYGTVLVTFLANGTKPVIIPPDVEQSGYWAGYVHKSKAKNRINAFIGGVVGSLTLPAILLTIEANKELVDSADKQVKVPVLQYKF